jgi:hypothetical protein
MTTQKAGRASAEQDVRGDLLRLASTAVEGRSATASRGFVPHGSAIVQAHPSRPRTLTQ